MEETRAWIEIGGNAAPQNFQVSNVDQGGRIVSIIVEALIDPSLFPQSAFLIIERGGTQLKTDLTTFAAAADARNGSGALPLHTLAEQIEKFVASGQTRRPRLLDLGGRRRSGNSASENFYQCDATVFDIVGDPGVDVVGDAHELSQYFPSEHFDFVISVSVFEHLLMPWKVALELNRVMRTGGYCLIGTHQVLGMHDMPWDFWRYSDTAWNGLFNAHTGFEIVQTGLGHFMHLVTVGWHPRYRGSEQAGGFESSGVLIRKVGPTDLTWNVRLEDVVGTKYPGSPNQKTPG
jgi:SAM-dependent methyltransferase